MGSPHTPHDAQQLIQQLQRRIRALELRKPRGGGTPEATAATANTLALRDGNARIKAADGVAADDVATKGYVDSKRGLAIDGYLEMVNGNSAWALPGTEAQVPELTVNLDLMEGDRLFFDVHWDIDGLSSGTAVGYPYVDGSRTDFGAILLEPGTERITLHRRWRHVVTSTGIQTLKMTARQTGSGAFLRYGQTSMSWEVYR